MSPHTSPATRALGGFGPDKVSTQLKDALDGSFDEKYQWMYFRKCHPHLPGAESAATLTAPTSLSKPK